MKPFSYRNVLDRLLFNFHHPDKGYTTVLMKEKIPPLFRPYWRLVSFHRFFGWRIWKCLLYHYLVTSFLLKRISPWIRFTRSLTSNLYWRWKSSFLFFILPQLLCRERIAELEDKLSKVTEEKEILEARIEQRNIQVRSCFPIRSSSRMPSLRVKIKNWSRIFKRGR